MKLTLIRGLPGSGKSTEAKKLNCMHIENDMFCVSNGVYKFDQNFDLLRKTYCLDQARDCARRNMDCVVSNTFTTVKDMQPYFEILLMYPNVDEFEVIRMDNKIQSIHNVPEEVYLDMSNRFESWAAERIIKASDHEL
jgi:adenylate kinase family enzyme